MNPEKRPRAEKRRSVSARGAKSKTVSVSAGSASDRAAGKKSVQSPLPRMTLVEVMRELEKAGSAQTRKTYARHGASQPMFGVSFATLKVLTKRIGKVEVDHGDTACKTPDAVEYIEKTWAHATAKGFESPAEQERRREAPRRRC